MRSVLAFLVASTVVPARADAQVHWQRQATVASRAGHGVAYDEHRQRTVLFGGFSDDPALRDTWEWDGQTWTQIATAEAPSLFGVAGLAYDSVRRRMMVLGRALAGGLEAWELVAGNWQQRTAPPGTWFQPSLAFDAGRGVMVMMGVPLGQSTVEVWESAGGPWTRVAVGSGSEARLGPLAYDAARQRCVMYCVSPAYESVVREWNGQAFTRIVTGSTPAPRFDGILAFDVAAQRVTLFGGMSLASGLPLQDTWEWNGTSWNERVTAPAPPPRSRGAMAADAARGRLVLVAGTGQAGLLGDTWEFDGTRWLLREDVSGPVRSQHAMAYDAARSRLVLFGGFAPPNELRGDTWEWDGRHWRDVSPAGGPPRRAGHAMAWDAARARVVLFGGMSLGNARLNDSWEWNGTSWSQRVTPVAPPPRASHGMTYDSRRDRIVVFGGASQTAMLADTWEWDGQTWTRRHDGFPPATGIAPMTYDVARGRSVLVTSGINGWLAVWEWNGTGWFSTNSTNGPFTYPWSVGYDEERQRVVVLSHWSSVAETWEWSGDAWSRKATDPAMVRTHDMALAWDATRRRLVSYGGWYHDRRPTHVTDYVSERPATWRAFGSGCGPATPTSSAVGNPWLGDTMRIGAVGLPAAAARLLALGASDRTWNGVPLPLSLTGQGFPSCSVLVSLDHLQPLGATSSVALTIPNATELIGVRFFHQAMAIDVAPLQIVLTDGGAGIVGVR